jgi:NAD(P)-dependent dehydrogenase (short-subunit alcohol dehydrogenase family)
MLKADTFQQEFAINVLGAVRVLKVVEERLFAANGAAVVLFSTVAVHRGMPFHASIAAAKGAVEGLAVSLAAEWAPKQVRVNVVAPSLTDTPLASRLLNSEKKAAAAAERHPLRRVGTAADSAAAASYLLSAESSWVTGQIIGVDGGMGTLAGV